MAAMQAQMSALRAENARLQTLLSSVQGIDVSLGASRAPPSVPSTAAPKKLFGEIKLWVGNWNMGARDPFMELGDLSVKADEAARMLAAFVPKGLDVYVFGVQEGISDKVFEAVEAYTGCFRVPLQTKIFGGSGNPARPARRMGKSVKIQSFIDEKSAGDIPDSCSNTVDMLDRVWGRGDGALMMPKFTGIAVFVAPVVAPYTRLLSVTKHSFGASEGSKGGVGVALGLYDVTIAFVNTHLASKRADIRRAQYQEIVDRLGSKLGGRGFGLNESFHHIVWMGDLNTHCKGVSAADAVELIRTGRHLQLLLSHDELLMEKEAGTSFWEYEEPLMAPRFFPTYKKLPGRGIVDTRDPDWVSSVYCTAYKEPFYKGGRVQERVPSWTDRIQYHSLPDRWGELLPESLDASRPDASPHNYHAINDALDTSDHSPIFATFSLQISTEETSEGADALALARYVEAMSGGGAAGVGGGPRATSIQLASTRLPLGVMADADFALLHPSLRPLVVVLRIASIAIDYGGVGIVPRAASVLFPLPYEDSDVVTERFKTTRTGPVMTFHGRNAGHASLAVNVRSTVSRSSRLETLHMLLKISLDDNTKAQCVIAMRDGGFVGIGSHLNTFKQPLTVNGVPFRAPNGSTVSVQFTIEMHSYERGGLQASAGGGGGGGGGINTEGGSGMESATPSAPAAYTASTASALSAASPARFSHSALDASIASLRSPSASTPSVAMGVSYANASGLMGGGGGGGTGAVTPNAEAARLKAVQVMAAARAKVMAASARQLGGV